MTIFISTGAFQTRTPDKLISMAHANGIMHLELSSGMVYTQDFLKPIRDAASSLTYLVHNYFPPPQKPFVLNLASTHDETLAQSKQMVRDGIDLCVEFGAPFYSVHAGFGMDLRPEDLGKPKFQSELPPERLVPKNQAYEILYNSVNELTAYADERGLRLLLENNVVTPIQVDAMKTDMLWMAMPDEFTTLLCDINHPALGILLDLAHLNVTANAFGFSVVDAVKAYHPYTSCLHISDNDGEKDTNQPIHSASWFLPLLPMFSTIPIVVEAYKLSVKQIHEQIALVKAAIYE